MHPKLKTLTAACAALTLGLGGALLMAAPANAAASDVTTPGWEWDAVQDDAAYIEDAAAFYSNYLGTGLNLSGFTSDAFDGFLNTFEISYLGASISPTFSPVSANPVDNGRSVIVATAAADFGDGAIVDITRTLEIQGSYARWTFAFDDGESGILADVSARIVGNVGSDGATAYTPIGTTGLLSNDGGFEDPIIGYDFTDGGTWAYDITDGDDDVAIDFSADLPRTLTVALLDWDPCSFGAAVTTMAALVPTLSSTFGETVPPAFLTNCLVTQSPTALEAGVATDQALGLSETAELAAWNYYDDEDAADRLNAFPLNLPAGLSLALQFDAVTGAPTLRLTGTAPAGTYNVNVLYYLASEGEGTFTGYPILSTITITVTAPALAATGAEVTPGLVGAAVISALGAGLLLVSRARRVTSR